MGRNCTVGYVDTCTDEELASSMSDIGTALERRVPMSASLVTATYLMCVLPVGSIWSLMEVLLCDYG